MKECRNIYFKRMRSTDYLRLNLTGRHLWDNLIVCCADDEGFLKYDIEWIRRECFPELPIDISMVEMQLQNQLKSNMLKIQNEILWIPTFLDYQKFVIITPSKLKKIYNPNLPTLRPSGKENRPKDRIPFEIQGILRDEILYRDIHTDFQPYFTDFQPLDNRKATVGQLIANMEVKGSEGKGKEVTPPTPIFTNGVGGKEPNKPKQYDIDFNTLILYRKQQDLSFTDREQSICLSMLKGGIPLNELKNIDFDSLSPKGV